MLSCAWLWVYLGAFLMLMELLSPGFVIFFFGLSAMTVGVCRFAFGEAFTLTGQLAAFSIFAILYLFFLRRWMKRIFCGETGTSRENFNMESVGRAGKVTQAIRPPLAGRVLIGDAEWSAVADEPIDVDVPVKVVGQSNITMRVKEI